MLFLPDFSPFPIDEIALIIDEVSFWIDFPANIVSESVIWTLLKHDITIGILIKDTNDVLDIVALATIVEKLLEVTIIQLLSVELLPALLVNDVAITSLN